MGWELKMLAACAARLATPKDDIERNAYRDAVLLHARNLTDCFLGERARATDIRHTHFTATDWTPAPRAAVQRLRDATPLLDKNLARSSWDQIDSERTGWNYVTIADDLVDVASAWHDYLAAVAPTLANAFGPQVSSARQRLEHARRQPDATRTTVARPGVAG